MARLFCFSPVTQRTDYDTKAKDTREWLRVGRGFMLSARVIWTELHPLLGPEGFADEHIDEMLAYWRSYLLLIAYAFENVYRGILVASGRSWPEALSPTGGHGLSKQIASVTTLNEDEANLIARLETYSHWAGKYVVPKEPETYAAGLRGFRISVMGSDLATAEGLFARLQEIAFAELAGRNGGPV
jgi:hypothetical protein